ncbi:protein of unknown function [Xenorhabdus nematophila AN6/1]|nr:hypothetical protein XNW1_2030023 [Xenorhabdus nematophila str. Websteri]CEK25462.1 protein of unknown function [Xenorhabdus nematophila AN6/1]
MAYALTYVKFRPMLKHMPNRFYSGDNYGTNCKNLQKRTQSGCQAACCV